MSGGFAPLLLVQVVMTCYIGCNIMGDYYTQKWANAPAEEQRAQFNFYVTVIFAFAIGAVLFIVVRVVSLLFMSLKVAKTAHNHILKLVLQSPINLFFDVTPVGKILNRFTKDLQCLDNVLCFNVGSFFACFYQAMASLIVAGFTVPYVLIATAFFVFLGALLFRFAL